MACTDGTITIRETVRYGIMRMLHGHDSAVTALCFFPGSHSLVSGAMDGSVMRWDSVISCLLSPPLNHAALMELGARIRTETEALSRLVSSGRVDSAVARALKLWASDGFTITSPFHSFLFSAWQGLGAREIREARLIATLSYSSAEAAGACFSPDGENLLCAWRDGTVQELHLVAGDVGQRRSVQGQGPHARVVALGQQGTLFLSTEQDSGETLLSRISAWEETEKAVVIGPCPGPQRYVSVSQDSAVLAAPVPQGMAITPAGKGACPSSMHLCTHIRVTAVAASPRKVACSDGGRTVCLVSPSSGQVLREIKAPDPVCALAWSANSRYLAAAGTEARITVWDTSRNTQLAVIEAGRHPASVMAWSPDNRHLASVDIHGVLTLSNIFTCSTLSPAAEPGPATALIWSPDGRYLAVACQSGRLLLYCVIPEVRGMEHDEPIETSTRGERLWNVPTV